MLSDRFFSFSTVYFHVSLSIKFPVCYLAYSQVTILVSIQIVINIFRITSHVLLLSERKLNTSYNDLREQSRLRYSLMRVEFFEPAKAK